MSTRKRRKLAVLGLVLGITVILHYAFAQESYTVRRKRACLRSGPGSFYPTVAELLKGKDFKVLGEEGGWYKAAVDTLDGYLSKRVTERKVQKEDKFSRLGDRFAEPRASLVVMSAGIKGFGEKYSKRFGADSTFVGHLVAYQIDQGEYDVFRQRTYEKLAIGRIRKEVDLEPYEEPICFTFSEEGLGLGIAAKIAGMGLYENEAVQDYVNWVGNLVVEGSDAYDVAFRFFILDSQHLNAYSCPGGTVFITKGLLGKVGSEAELACVLGHEIAHVARHHGMRESEERKTEIRAKEAFAELPTFEKADVDKELDELALEICDRIFEGRLAEYEEESDRVGLVFAARAGYDPRAMVGLLERIGRCEETSNNEHYTRKQVGSRQKRIKKRLGGRKWPRGLLTNESRLQDHLAALR